MMLADRFPDTPDPDAVFDAFSAWAQEQGFSLYPHQEEALIEIASGANVVVSTPTGSGKSLIALGAHFAALAHDPSPSTPPRSRRWCRRSSSPCAIFSAPRTSA